MVNSRPLRVRLGHLYFLSFCEAICTGMHVIVCPLQSGGASKTEHNLFFPTVSLAWTLKFSNLCSLLLNSITRLIIRHLIAPKTIGIRWLEKLRSLMQLLLRLVLKYMYMYMYVVYNATHAFTSIHVGKEAAGVANNTVTRYCAQWSIRIALTCWDCLYLLHKLISLYRSLYQIVFGSCCNIQRRWFAAASVTAWVA